MTEHREPTDVVRELADAALAELRAAPFGLTKADLGRVLGASPASIQRAMTHARQHGVAVYFDRSVVPPVWAIGPGRDRLPAAGLSRADLLGRLHELLGRDQDPLGRIEELLESEAEIQAELARSTSLGPLDAPTGLRGNPA